MSDEGSTSVDEALVLIEEAGISGESRVVLDRQIERGWWERIDELYDACTEYGVKVHDGTWMYDGKPRVVIENPGDAYWSAYDRASWLLMLGIYPTPTISEGLRNTLKPELRHRRHPGLQNGQEAAGRRRALREAGYERAPRANLFHHPNPLRAQPRRPLG